MTSGGTTPLPDIDKILKDKEQRKRTSERKPSMAANDASSAVTRESLPNPRQEKPNGAPDSRTRESPANQGKRERTKRRNSPSRSGSMSQLNSLMKTLLDASDLINSEGGHLDSGSSLPEVVVVGDQSDGKSTLLEAISGVTLPKGQGICTRCPIRLCIRSADIASATIQYGNSTVQVENLADFEEKLRAAQIAVAGDGKDISPKPINAIVRGPGLPNLSMVDLPGINRESKEREETIIQLIKSHISQDRAVIVVVAKATNDIASSKGHQMAMDDDVDPDKERTLLVLTNCDGSLVNREDSISELLKKEGENVFAVRCFRERDSALTREELFEQENRFFREHDLFKSHRSVGTSVLVGSLVAMLSDKLAAVKSDIVDHVKKWMRRLEKELKDLTTDEKELRAECTKYFYSARKEFEELVTGSHRFDDNSPYGRCRKVWDKFAQNVLKTVEDLKNELPDRIQKEDADQLGREVSQLPNAFPIMERIVGGMVDDVRPHVETLISETQKIVTKMLSTVVDTKLREFSKLSSIPGLAKKLILRVENGKERFAEEAASQIRQTLDMHKIVQLNNPSTEKRMREMLSKLPGDFDPSKLLQKLAENSRASGDGSVKGAAGGELVESNVWSMLTSALCSSVAQGSSQNIQAMIAAQFGLPAPVARILLQSVQFFMELRSDGGENEGDFHKWFDKRRLEAVTEMYVDVVRDRLIDMVPMAVVHFWNRKLAHEICDVISEPGPDEFHDLFCMDERKQKAETVQAKLNKVKEISERLDRMQMY